MTAQSCDLKHATKESRYLLVALLVSRLAQSWLDDHARAQASRRT
jgi:hypothetical protein